MKSNIKNSAAAFYDKEWLIVECAEVNGDRISFLSHQGDLQVSTVTGGEDTHIRISPQNIKEVLLSKFMGISGKNNVKVIQETDGNKSLIITHYGETKSTFLTVGIQERGRKEQRITIPSESVPLIEGFISEIASESSVHQHVQLKGLGGIIIAGSNDGGVTYNMTVLFGEKEMTRRDLRFHRNMLNYRALDFIGGKGVTIPDLDNMDEGIKVKELCGEYAIIGISVIAGDDNIMIALHYDEYCILTNHVNKIERSSIGNKTECPPPKDSTGWGDCTLTSEY